MKRLSTGIAAMILPALCAAQVSVVPSTVAAMKRPVRTQNLEGLFFDSGVWQALHDALTGRDAARARAEFRRAREPCMACHLAEQIGFINQSAAFRRTETFPSSQK